jgi:uncharacterized beta-barrel protein YwiB (DUF1934 family)
MLRKCAISIPPPKKVNGNIIRKGSTNMNTHFKRFRIKEIGIFDKKTNIIAKHIVITTSIRS